MDEVTSTPGPLPVSEDFEEEFEKTENDDMVRDTGELRVVSESKQRPVKNRSDTVWWEKLLGAKPGVLEFQLKLR